MLTLHFAPNSRAGRIVWLLEELGLAYDINKMAFHPQIWKSDAHRARHPLGRVPVLDDGDIRIFESGAIVEYVLARHKNGGLKPAGRLTSFLNICSGFIIAYGDAAREHHRDGMRAGRRDETAPLRRNVYCRKR